MNWDWEKLQSKRRGGPNTGGPQMPRFDMGEGLKKLKGVNIPAGKLVLALLLLAWLLSGIYIVEPDEAGVVLRFGAYSRITESGPHYHLPFPIESAQTPKVTQIRRVEIGFRSFGLDVQQFQQGQSRLVPEESLMLTGDENIVNVQFSVQYQIKDPVQYLFQVSDPETTVKNAAEAAMREVIGDNDIDSALTTDKLKIQTQTQDLLQTILDRYMAGVRVVAVQMQDVHPPQEVSDAFKDVASAREDRIRFINEADAYRNDLLPKARGLAAQYINEAEAYKESVTLKAQGEANRFLAILAEYSKAKDVTRQRLYLETMEAILANPNLEKVFIEGKALDKVLPYLPLDSVRQRAGDGARPDASGAGQGGDR